MANLRAQNAITIVKGPNTKVSAVTPDAKFPRVFKIKYAKTIQMPTLIIILLSSFLRAFIFAETMPVNTSVKVIATITKGSKLD